MRILVLLALVAATAQSQPTSLLPVPRSLQLSDGRLTLDSNTTLAITGFRNTRLESAVKRFVKRAELRTGVPMLGLRTTPTSPATIAVKVTGAGMAVQGMDEDESYSIDVSSSQALLSAPTVVGALRGLETLLQLITSDARSFYLPAVKIEDAPRFAWRGLLVDVGRHFMPVEQIKRTIDGMAMVKLNVLHWHLTEDQGFRVESKRYPKLHQLGSDGQYYTQEQLKDVVAYARDRGIRVVPEFDMPGHSTAWFIGYPHLSTQPNASIAIRREWGGADAIFDPSKEAAYTMIDRFIGEMAVIFPDAYWHIGGDEVEDKHWDNNRRIAAWKKQRGFKSNEAVQLYFNRRLTRILQKYGKRMVGWDEILNPDLPKQTVVQSWRGVEYLGKATAAGYASILSAPYYLDHVKPATDFYLADPLPDSVRSRPGMAELVFGGEACMWSEFVSDESTDSRLWPRLGAVAERLWSRADVRDVPDMYRRLNILSARLDAIGLRVQSHTARSLRRLIPEGNIAPMESLLTTLQPPFFGQVLQGKRTNQFQPLSRIVDAARPDPAGRWLTERLVRRLNQNRADRAAADSLAEAFTRWQENVATVRGMAILSPLVGQALPGAEALARTTKLGLEAIAHLRAGTRPTSEWIQMALAELKGYEQPQGLLRVSIVPEVRALIAGLGVAM